MGIKITAPLILFNEVINMSMLQTTPETIADLKQILKDRGIESNSLRIIAQIG